METLKVNAGNIVTPETFTKKAMVDTTREYKHTWMEKDDQGQEVRQEETFKIQVNGSYKVPATTQELITFLDGIEDKTILESALDELVQKFFVLPVVNAAINKKRREYEKALEGKSNTVKVKSASAALRVLARNKKTTK